jgi:hypothetical protein
MFKQVKSALFWYYLFKFRRRVILIVLLLVIAFFANAIYGDVIEYLKLKDRLEFLEIALISKWTVIIFNIVFSIYLILTIFKKEEKEQKNVEVKKEIQKKEEKFTQREKEFLYKKKLKTKRFECLFDAPPPNEYVSLDCETTGLNPKKDEILSIGAVLIKDNKILMRQTFNVFVKPSKLINPESIKIHLLRETDLENAQEPEIAIFQLLNFIGSRPIVGYYIEFDIAMISKYTKKIIGVKLPNQAIEVSGIL